MEVIDFIDLSVLDAAGVTKAVNKYISDREQILSSLDVSIRVSIIKTSKTARAGKSERRDMLGQLIAANPDAQTVWQNGPYKFDFARLSFQQHGKDIYLTSGEAVQLYQLLVRGNKGASWSAYYANMRSKIGKDFLKGFV